MKTQWRNVQGEEQEQVRVRRVPVAWCECCGAAVQPRASWFTALYTLLCRACWLIETSACQDEVMYDKV
jgi:hypothetical protein